MALVKPQIRFRASATWGTPLTGRRRPQKATRRRCLEARCDFELMQGPEFEAILDTESSISYKELREFNIVQPIPGPLQQTLWRSFVIGGIGLHSGETAYVRVRPAFAGEGRYFVRVPLGTNRELAYPYDDEGSEVQIYPPVEKELDVEDETYRSELFVKYLDYKEREGYTAGFDQFVQDYAEQKGIELVQEERLREREEPVAKSDTERILPATLDHLANEEPLYETTLESADGLRVESVEHLLAALEACGVDNARIEIEGGPEVPIVDGSSLGWTVEIENVGVTVAECRNEEESFYVRAALKPEEIVRVQDGDAFILLVPGDEMQLTYGIDHTEACPQIGSQWFSWGLQNDKQFRLHLAAAKTYVTHANDLYEMRSRGYMKGGAEHVVLIGNGFKWADDALLSYSIDEPVRHKLLDLIGDLSLLAEDGMSGLPFGHIIAYKATHAMHHAFARELQKKYRQQYQQYMTTEQILAAPSIHDQDLAAHEEDAALDVDLEDLDETDA